MLTIFSVWCVYEVLFSFSFPYLPISALIFTTVNMYYFYNKNWNLKILN